MKHEILILSIQGFFLVLTFVTYLVISTDRAKDAKFLKEYFDEKDEQYFFLMRFFADIVRKDKKATFEVNVEDLKDIEDFANRKKDK